jgi:hypothetical protein
MDISRRFALGALAALPLPVAAAPDPHRAGFLLGPGPAGRCDDAKVGVGVIRRAPRSGRWLMWYYCRDKDFAKDAPATLASGYVALATSRDGRAWTRVDGPGPKGSVLWPSADPADFDSLHVGVLDISRDGDEWVMWYFGGDRTPRETRVGTVVGVGMRTGLARSKDGVTWRKVRGRAAGGALVDWGSDVFAAWPNGVIDQGRYTLLYTAVDRDVRLFRTLRATSTDGADFTPQGPVRFVGETPPWRGGGIMTRSIISNPDRNGPRWLMAYTALDGRPDRFHRRTIAAAVSDDLETWTDLYPEPFFTAGPPGAWDEGGVAAPQLVRNGRALWMSYISLPKPGQAADLPHGIGLAISRSGQLTDFRRI